MMTWNPISSNVHFIPYKAQTTVQRVSDAFSFTLVASEDENNTIFIISKEIGKSFYNNIPILRMM